MHVYWEGIGDFFYRFQNCELSTDKSRQMNFTIFCMQKAKREVNEVFRISHNELFLPYFSSPLYFHFLGSMCTRSEIGILFAPKKLLCHTARDMLAFLKIKGRAQAVRQPTKLRG